MYPEDIDPQSGCRLPLPRREDLDGAGQRIYDSLADPEGGTLRGLRGPGGILLHSPDLSRYARPLNRYLRHEAGLGGRVRELAILTTARELDSQFEWAAHEPEAHREGISREIIEIIKHRLDTSGLVEADAIVIDLGREIFGTRKVLSATFARELQRFGRRALVDLVALMGNYAGTARCLPPSTRSWIPINRRSCHSSNNAVRPRRARQRLREAGSAQAAGIVLPDTWLEPQV
jgi:4-carboxymuconolactone decarboxylase